MELWVEFITLYSQTMTEMDYSLIYLIKTNKRNKDQLKKTLIIYQSLPNNIVEVRAHVI